MLHTSILILWDLLWKSTNGKGWRTEFERILFDRFVLFFDTTKYAGKMHIRVVYFWRGLRAVLAEIYKKRIALLLRKMVVCNMELRLWSFRIDCFDMRYFGRHFYCFIATSLWSHIFGLLFSYGRDDFYRLQHCLSLTKDWEIFRTYSLL